MALRHLIAYSALVSAAVALVIGVIYVLFASLAAPAELPMPLSHPNEQLLRSALANAALSEAEPSVLYDVVMDLAGLKKGLDLVFLLTRAMSGGLWVGGRVFLTSHQLVFAPNSINKAVHMSSLAGVVIQLSDIASVTDEWAILTHIVNISTRSGVELKFRLYSAEEFSAAIRERVSIVRGEKAPRALATDIHQSEVVPN